jgi:hypothetical protein
MYAPTHTSGDGTDVPLARVIYKIEINGKDNPAVVGALYRENVMRK